MILYRTTCRGVVSENRMGPTDAFPLSVGGILHFRYDPISIWRLNRPVGRTDTVDDHDSIQSDSPYAKKNQVQCASKMSIPEWAKTRKNTHSAQQVLC